MYRLSTLFVLPFLSVMATSLMAQFERPVRLVLVQSVTTTEPDIGFGNPTFATVEITGEETIELAEDEYLEVDNLKDASDSPISNCGLESGLLVDVGGDALPYLAGVGDVVVGPATCRLFCKYRNDPANQTSKMTYVANAIITSGTPSLGELQSDPFGRLVIPEDTMGQVNVFLEQSSDLINWTGASPGPYDPIYNKRFFRLRVTVDE